MEVGDWVEINPLQPNNPHAGRMAGQFGKIVGVRERRPPFEGFSNDQMTIEWSDGSNSDWSTYWLRLRGDYDYNDRVMYWLTFFTK
jgi:hypothetical protein